MDYLKMQEKLGMGLMLCIMMFNYEQVHSCFMLTKL